MAKRIYGLELVVELFGCEYKIIRSKKKLEKFLVEAINLTGLEAYGKPKMVRFSDGYGFFQFLTTSSISGQCIDEDNMIFLNIFSCGVFDEKIMAKFSKKYFRAKWMKKRAIYH